MHGNCQSGELACMLPLICLTQEQMNQLSRYAGSVKVNYQISIKEHEKYPDCRGTRHTCVYSQRTVNIVHRQIEFRKPHNANIDVEQRKEISEEKNEKQIWPRGPQLYGINPCILCNIPSLSMPNAWNKQKHPQNKKALLVVQIIRPRWFMSARLKSVGDRIGGRRIKRSDQRLLMSRTRTLESSKVEGY